MGLKKFNAQNFRHLKIVELTATGMGVAKVANELQIGKNTVTRVLEKPEAQQMLSDAMEAIQARVVITLPALVEQSLKTLLEAQTAFGADYPTRVNAAKAGLSAMLKLSEIVSKTQQIEKP